MTEAYALPRQAAYPRLSWPWRTLAWLIAVSAWLLAAGAIALLISSAAMPIEVANWLMDVTTAVVYGIIVALMLPRTRHPVVWVLALTAIGCGASAFATGYVTLAGDWPGKDLAFYLPYWAWVPGVYGTAVIVPLLVLPGARRRWPAIALGCLLVTAATLPSMTATGPGLPPNLFAVDWQWWQQVRVEWTIWPHRAVGVLAALEWVWLLLKVLRTPAQQRRGVIWLLAGHTAMLVALATFLLPVPDAWTETAAEVSGVLLLVAQLFLPAAVLVLVLGQQMWGIDARVNRGVVWAVMTVTVALAYLMLIALAAWVAPNQTEVAVALAVGLVGLGSTPLRQLVQRRVDRLVYGPGADPGALLSGVGSDAGYDIDGLAAALSRGLRLADVQIVPTAAQPPSSATGGEVTLALTSRGRDVGVLVARPLPGERLDQRTTRMLSEVAGLVAMTIDLQQSIEALTAARRRMAGIRHEERRMLRRDLHDGLGPALAGIRLGLVAARGMQERDPEAAEEMLNTLERELTQQGEEVRRLSRSLVPLALEDGDLASALAALGERFADSDLAVRVSVAPDVELDPSVQVAIYQMASEALLNVRRHAEASACEVLLRRRADGDTLFVVTDDGVGLPADTVEGIGLRSMRERAEELGGVLRVTTPTTGTGSRVELRLPGGG